MGRRERIYQAFARVRQLAKAADGKGRARERPAPMSRDPTVETLLVPGTCMAILPDDDVKTIGKTPAVPHNSFTDKIFKV